MLIMLSLSSASGQVQKDFQRAISIEPLSLIWSNTLYAVYEHKLSDVNSFTVFLLRYNKGEKKGSIAEEVSYGLGASYRWYVNDEIQLFKNAIQGLSIGPFANIHLIELQYSDKRNNITDFYAAIGGEVAFKHNFSNWFVEPIIRVGFEVLNPTGYNYNFISYGINLGYAW